MIKPATWSIWVVLIVIMFIIGWWLIRYNNVVTNYTNTIEAGFSNTRTNRWWFRLTCFLLLVLFAVFDLELVCMVWLIYQYQYIMLLFITVVTIGVYVEWTIGRLLWS